ncbi:hypothetical protein MASR2M15_00550 [Anaerolineales bacterium]
MKLPISTVIAALLNDTEADSRKDAANWLARNAPSFSADEQAEASRALDKAMMDPSPDVLMAVMTALSALANAAPRSSAPDITDLPPATEVTAQGCSVCGKPEFLIDPESCEYANCPYR